MSRRHRTSILTALLIACACEDLPDDLHGRERWRRTLRPTAIAVAPDGDLLATTYDRELIRIDPDGAERSTRLFDYDGALLDVSMNGDLLVGGRDHELGSNPPLVIERLEPDGTPRWSMTAAMEGHQTYLHGAVAGSDLTFIMPSFVLLDTEDANPPVTAFMWVVDADGTLNREDDFPSLRFSERQVAKHPDGGFVLFVRAPEPGTDFGFGALGPEDAAFVRFDDEGVVVDQIVRPDLHSGQRFAIGSDAGLYVTNAAAESLMIKIDPGGSTEWQVPTDGSGNAHAQGIVVDGDVAFVAGQVNEGTVAFPRADGQPGPFLSDGYFVASFDTASGALLWARSLDCLLDDPFAADAARGTYTIEFTPGDATDSSLVARTN